MTLDRQLSLSEHYVLGDLLVDKTFPELASALAPSDAVLGNLRRLCAVIDAIVAQYPPKWDVLSGYRNPSLNEACRQAGLPASVGSLHLFGCAADIRPRDSDLDLEEVFEWIRAESRGALLVHEAVFYPNKGFIHVAVESAEKPTSKRILMRT